MADYARNAPSNTPSTASPASGYAASRENFSNGYSAPASSNPRAHRCPIKGCNLTYAKGTVGWAKHVGSPESHPYWHPHTPEADVRRKLFEAEFPAFFEGSRHFLNSRTPPPPPSSTRALEQPSMAQPPQYVAPVQPVQTASVVTIEQVKAAIREVLQEALREAVNKL